MRKLLFLMALVGALAVPAAGLAQAPAPVICGTACDGGGGSTGCWQASWWRDRGIQYVDYSHHVVVAQWCKSNGIVTSFQITQHYCNVSGFVQCSVGPAYLTGGGVGFGWVTFVGFANVQTTPGRLAGWSLTDEVDGSIAPG